MCTVCGTKRVVSFSHRVDEADDIGTADIRTASFCGPATSLGSSVRSVALLSTVYPLLSYERGFGLMWYVTFQRTRFTLNYIQSF